VLGLGRTGRNGANEMKIPPGLRGLFSVGAWVALIGLLVVLVGGPYQVTTAVELASLNQARLDVTALLGEADRAGANAFDCAIADELGLRDLQGLDPERPIVRVKVHRRGLLASWWDARRDWYRYVPDVTIVPVTENGTGYLAAFPRTLMQVHQANGLVRVVGARETPITVGFANGYAVAGVSPGRVGYALGEVKAGRLPAPVPPGGGRPTLSVRVFPGPWMLWQSVRPYSSGSQAVHVSSPFAIFNSLGAYGGLASLACEVQGRPDGAHIEVTMAFRRWSRWARVVMGLKPVAVDPFEGMVPSPTVSMQLAGGPVFDALFQDLAGRVRGAKGARGATAGPWQGDLALTLVSSPREGDWSGLVAVGVSDGADAQKWVARQLPTGMSSNAWLTGTRRLDDVDIRVLTAPTGSWDRAAANVEVAVVGNRLLAAWGSSELMDAAIRHLHRPILCAAAGVDPAVVGRGRADGVRLIQDLLTAFRGMNGEIIRTVQRGADPATFAVWREGCTLRASLRIPRSEVIAVRRLVWATVRDEKPRRPESQYESNAMCEANLRQIDAAKEMCAIARGLEDGAEMKPEWLIQHLKGGRLLVCPAGGSYSIRPVGQPPTCSAPGHEGAGPPSS
jgi:hypothetical protein